jgi:hypothetical protein
MLRRRLLTSALLLVALAGFVVAGRAARTGEEQARTPVRAIEARFPPEGAVTLAREMVGVDLAPGFAGRLVVGGVPIPPDQINCIECPAPDTGPDPLNRVLFRPGPGQVIEDLPNGPLCAVALIWPVDQGESAAQEARWCFRVGA